MPDQDNQNPTGSSQSDISKAQSQQQPPNQASQGQQPSAQSGQFETSSQGSERSGDQAQTGQQQGGQGFGSDSDQGLQGDTQTQQRTDIEGAGLSGSSTGESGGFGGESGQAGSSFVGSQSQQDSSSELISEEDEDFAQDGQGASEGK